MYETGVALEVIKSNGQVPLGWSIYGLVDLALGWSIYLLYIIKYTVPWSVMTVIHKHNHKPINSWPYAAFTEVTVR